MEENKKALGGFSVEENRKTFGAKIRVIGVGGGGGNMINHIIRENSHIDRIDLIVANTDSQALSDSLAQTKIQLGEKLTKGLGAGMTPDIGKQSAQESKDDIKSALEYSDIVFIAAGFGGGTGTGASPVIAQIAQELNALTIAIVTTPFPFEGKKKKRLALSGIEELKKECNSVIVIPNEKLTSLVDKKATLKDAFRIVDDVLAKAVCGMYSVILEHSESNMNVDFADVKKIMSNRGLSIIGVGVSSGEDAAIEAVKEAVNSPLLDNASIEGAMGVLVHFKIGPECSMFEIDSAMNLVNEAVDEDATIIVGTTSDDNVENNRVEVTIIATGFKNKDELKEINSEKPSGSLLKLKVSGGLEDFEIRDDLDSPTYIKYNMD